MKQRARIFDMAFSLIQAKMAADCGVTGYINSRLRDPLWMELLLLEEVRVCVYWEIYGRP